MSKNDQHQFFFSVGYSMKVVEHILFSAVTVITSVRSIVKMTRVTLKMEPVLILNLDVLIHTAVLVCTFF